MVLFITALGLSIGSFLGLCIDRLPREESVVYPPSHCDACGRRLGAVELIPVLGFLIYRGRCRTCGTRVPLRYLLLELSTAGIYLCLWLRFGPAWAAVQYAFLLSLLILIAGIDLQTYTIPDELVLLGLLAGLIFIGIRGGSWLDAVWGFILGGGLLLAIAVLSRGGMGGGDVKLGFMVGLHLGWKLVLVALLAAVFTGAVTGLMLIIQGQKNRKDAIPFAPFMAAGTCIAVFWGKSLINWYLLVFF